MTDRYNFYATYRHMQQQQQQARTLSANNSDRAPAALWRTASFVSDASNDSLTRSHQRLSRLPRNTHCAIVLNQIQHVEIRPSAQRADSDGVALFVVDVFLRSYQTGIPDIRMSAEFIDEYLSHKSSVAGSDLGASAASVAAATATMTTTTPTTTADMAASAVTVERAPPQTPPRSAATAAPQMTPRLPSEHDARATHDAMGSRCHIESKHAPRPQQPQYQIEYRYSAFRKLRRELRCIVESSGESIHLKWCDYCSTIQYITTFSSFPSRHPLVRFVARRLLCRDDLEQAVLERLLRRSRKLTHFVNRVLHSAKNGSYRYQAAGCDCYARVSSIVTDFLSEPHARMSSGDV